MAREGGESLAVEINEGDAEGPTLFLLRRNEAGETVSTREVNSLVWTIYSSGRGSYALLNTGSHSVVVSGATEGVDHILRTMKIRKGAEQ